MDSTTGRQEPAAAPARNAPGLAALVCAVVAVLLSALLTLGQAAFLRVSASSVQALGAYSAGREVLTTLLGVAALVLGLIGVVGARPQKPVAAAGLALGASLVFGGVVAAVYPLLLAVLPA